MWLRWQSDKSKVYLEQQLILIDDDQIGSAQLEATATAGTAVTTIGVDEGAESAGYKLAIDKATTVATTATLTIAGKSGSTPADVSVKVGSANAAAYSAPITLTIPAGSKLSQEVKFSVPDDANKASEEYTITIDWTAPAGVSAASGAFADDTITLSVADDDGAQMTLTIPAGNEGDTIVPTIAFSSALKAEASFYNFPAQSSPASATIASGDDPTTLTNCDICYKDADIVTVATSVTANTPTNMGAGFIIRDDSTSEGAETFVYNAVLHPSLDNAGALNTYLAARGIAKTGHTIVVAGRTLTNQTITVDSAGGTAYATLKTTYTIPADNIPQLTLKVNSASSSLLLAAGNKRIINNVNSNYDVVVNEPPSGDAAFVVGVGFTAALTSTSGATLTVRQNAIRNADIYAHAASATLNATNASATSSYSIAVRVDNIAEDEESHRVSYTVTAGGGLTLSSSIPSTFTVTVKIRENGPLAKMTLTIPAGEEGDTITPTVAFSAALKADTKLHSYALIKDPVSATTNNSQSVPTSSNCSRDVCADASRVTIATSVVAHTVTNLGAVLLNDDNTPEGAETFTFELNFSDSIDDDSTTDIDGYLAKRGIAKTGHTVVVAGKTLTNQSLEALFFSDKNFVVLLVEYIIPANDLITFWF